MNLSHNYECCLLSIWGLGGIPSPTTYFSLTCPGLVRICKAICYRCEIILYCLVNILHS